MSGLRATVIALLAAPLVTSICGCSDVDDATRPDSQEAVSGSRATAQTAKSDTVEEISEAWNERETEFRSGELAWKVVKTWPSGGLTESFERSRRGRLSSDTDHLVKRPAEDAIHEFENTLIFDGQKMCFQGGGPIWSTKKNDFLLRDIVRVWNNKIGKSLATASENIFVLNRGHIYDHYRDIRKMAPIFPVLVHYRPSLFKEYISLNPDSIASQRVTIDGASCVEISRFSGGSGRRISFYLDPDRGYSIRRQEIIYDQELLSQLEVSYVEDPKFGWVPSAWKWSDYSADGKLKWSVEATMFKHRFNFAIDPKAFELDFPEGALVYDHRKDDVLRRNDAYIVRAGGDLRPVNDAEMKRVADDEGVIDVQELLRTDPGTAGLPPLN